MLTRRRVSGPAGQPRGAGPGRSRAQGDRGAKSAVPEPDRGTGFDDFSPRSHHAAEGLAAEVQRNRFVLLGLMTAAGWDFYRNEWWHYQLFDSRAYPLLSDRDLDRPMM